MIYCHPCRHFGRFRNPKWEGKGSRFKNWKKATENIRQHALNQAHRVAEVSLVNWKKSQQTTDIRGGILQRYMKGAAKNCAYVGTVAEVVNFCGRHAVPLRGHDEGIRSDNRGNFLEILEIIARHDPIVKSRLDHGRRYYTSPAIQNELLQIQAELIHGDICSEVREATFYSVMAYQSRDLSKHEQISITLRYFREGRIHDCFLCFARMENLTAESLSHDILRAIERGGVNLDGTILLRC